VTTNNAEAIDGDLGDEVGKAQQELDAQQGLVATPTLTAEQVQAMLQPVVSQVAGLSSKIDRGLNAIREDTSQWAKAELGNMQGALGREQWLAGMDPDQREYTEMLLSQMPAAPQPEAQAPVVTATAGVPSATEQAQFEAVKSIVRDFGLSPEDPSLRQAYTIMSAPGLTPEMRQQQFLGELSRVKVGHALAAQAPAATRAQASVAALVSNTASPPIAPGGHSAASLNTAEQLREAYTHEQITREQFREGMNNLKLPG
jgi:hypothetical protein